MRAWRVTVLAAGIAAAALGQAWKPGGEYSGSGVRTNATYDPFLGNILPYSANVQVVGRIATNDMAVFTDRSGRYVRGTNFIGMVEAAASNAAASAGYATTGQVAAAVAVITANLQAEIAGSTGTLVRAESTNGWQVGAHQAWLTNETDAAALAALDLFSSTNTVTRWYDPELPTRWAEWDGGTNIVIYRAEVIGTNFVVTSDGPLMDITVEPPDYRIYTEQVFPFTDLAWTGTMSEGSPATLTITATDSAVWSVTTSTFPAVLLPQNAYSIGTATVSVASYSYTTNVEWRYVLPTNAIPYEFQNIDYLQGWLNNLYAGKAELNEALTNAPAWIGVTNYAAACTVTNALERPQFLYATGDVSVAFAGLRPPQPFYFVLRGPSSVAFPAGTHFVGGGSWQTNMSNHFVVWQYGTNLFVNPVTTSED